jgi:hypothetical protein
VRRLVSLFALLILANHAHSIPIGVGELTRALNCGNDLDCNYYDEPVLLGNPNASGPWRQSTDSYGLTELWTSSSPIENLGDLYLLLYGSENAGLIEREFFPPDVRDPSAKFTRTPRLIAI